MIKRYPNNNLGISTFTFVCPYKAIPFFASTHQGFITFRAPEAPEVLISRSCAVAHVLKDTSKQWVLLSDKFNSPVTPVF